jgi:hypothetical protein
MFYQEKLLGYQAYYVFALALLLGLSGARGPVRELERPPRCCWRCRSRSWAPSPR